MDCDFQISVLILAYSWTGLTMNDIGGLTGSIPIQTHTHDK